MVDIDAEKCEGQVMDLEDSSFVSDTRVRIGTFRDASRADIAVITAGAKFRKGETRYATQQRRLLFFSTLFIRSDVRSCALVIRLPHTVLIC